MRAIQRLRLQGAARLATALVLACLSFASCGGPSSERDEDGGDDSSPGGAGTGVCTSDLDCREGEVCENDACRRQCDSDNDCTQLGLLCDTASGFCVRCLENAHCPEGSSCRAGECARDSGDGGAGPGGGGEAGVGATSGDGGNAGAGATSGDGGTGGTEPTGGSGGSAGTDPTGGNGGSAGSNPTGGGGAGGRGGTAGMGGTAGAQAGSAGSAIAGSAGTGGSTTTPCANEAVIDDLEDQDSILCAWPNRTGSWYLAKRPSVGTITPASTPFAAYLFTDRLGYGIRFTGSGFSGSGNWAVIGAKLSGLGPYDATRYTGIRFWARSTSTLDILVNLPTVASAGTANGGTCIPQASLLCDNHWGALKVFTQTWTQFDVAFASGISRHGDTWGLQSPKDFGHLLAVEFLFHTMYNSVGTFAFYIDDVTFY